MTHNLFRPPPTPRGRREGTAGAWRTEKRRTSSSSSSSSQLLQFGDLPPIVLSSNTHQEVSSGYPHCLEGAIKEHEDRLMAARGTRLGNRRRRRRKRNENGGYKGTLRQRYEDGDPEVGLLGEASGRGDFEYYVLYSRPPKLDHNQICSNYLDVAPTGWDDI
ncbi:unnamed protein product [Linum trigynum]|uniref:Uncharacterized protein n=1 Tax=Linum trigynum TaxID=586398 RepID=A0AAV2GBS0_9ROSI